MGSCLRTIPGPSATAVSVSEFGIVRPRGQIPGPRPPPTDQPHNIMAISRNIASTQSVLYELPRPERQGCFGDSGGYRHAEIVVAA